MYITWGARGNTVPLGRVMIPCRYCDRSVYHAVFKRQRMMTVYFIPLIPLERTYLIACGHCRALTEADDLAYQLELWERAGRPATLPEGDAAGGTPQKRIPGWAMASAFLLILGALVTMVWRSSIATPAEEDYYAGVWHLQHDEYREAVTMLSRSLARKPSGDAYYARALAYCKLRQEGAAVRDYADCLRVEPLSTRCNVELQKLRHPRAGLKVQ